MPSVTSSQLVPEARENQSDEIAGTILPVPAMSRDKHRYRVVRDQDKRPLVTRSFKTKRIRTPPFTRSKNPHRIIDLRGVVCLFEMAAQLLLSAIVPGTFTSQKSVLHLGWALRRLGLFL